ncbi:MAG: hypothetical protein VW802_05020 [Rhodospirillaceae bacterium]|jgi:protein O-GlcNAc transferase
MSTKTTKKAKKAKKSASPSKSNKSTLDTFLSKATKLLQSSDWDALEDACVAYTDKHGECIETLYIKTFIAHGRNDLRMAIDCAEQALKFDDACDEIADTIATLYALAGELSSCVYYAKIASTLEKNPKFKSLIPPSFPTFTRAYSLISEKPMHNRAQTAFNEGDFAQSEHWYRQHLSFDPKDKDAYLGMTAGMLARGEVRGVADSLRAGRHALPYDPEIASQLAHTLIRLGKYTEAHACHRWAQKAAPDNAVIHAQALVDLMIDPEQQNQDFPALTKAWGKRFGQGSGEDDDASDFFETEDPMPKDQLTIGFMLGSTGNIARGVTLSSILMQLDENRFQTVGFGVGALSDVGNAVFQKCIGRWHDVAGVDPITLKAIIAAEEIDIMVNISGFSMPELLALFGSRLAPCQVAWMGTPYGTGIDEIDYLITDSFLDPDKNNASQYTEELTFLELGGVVAFPLVSKQEGLMPRTGDEFIFAADAKLHELTPSTIACWAEILHQKPDSSLILLDHDFKQAETLNELVQLFGTFGIANRVDIVDSSVSSKFFEQADVCLMPVPTPSAQVTVDALWGGCPVISFANTGRHTRESGSVLSYLGLQEDMVADNLDDYAKFALEWANDDEKRSAFRTSVREKILTSQHFDTKARAADLQKTFDLLWQKTCEKH